MLPGIEFKRLGAGINISNDLSPGFDLVGGMTSSLCEDERNERPGLLYTTKRSLIYSSALL